MTDPANVERPPVYVASGLTMLLGVWLVISASTPYAHGPMVANNILFGVLIGILAGVRASGGYPHSWVSWADALLGAWVVLSPVVVMGLLGPTGPSIGMVVNNAVVGIAVAALGCWSARATDADMRMTADTPGRASYGH